MGRKAKPVLVKRRLARKAPENAAQAEETMISIHALWNGSAFCLWGEDSEVLLAFDRAQHPQAVNARVRPHPFSLTHVQLRKGLDMLARSFYGKIGADERISLSLSSIFGRPLCSPELAKADDRVASTEGSISSASWAVPCLSLRPAEAVALLAALPDALPAAVGWGASLRYWAEACVFSRQLLVRGQFVPQANEDGNPTRVASLRRLSDRDAVYARFRVLALAMPTFGRASDSDGKPRKPDEILRGFLVDTAGAAIPYWLMSGAPSRRRRGPEMKNPSEARPWLAALISRSPKAHLPLEEEDTFTMGRRTISFRLPAGEVSAYRTCFRLDPPEEGGNASGTNSWKISFFLQSADDPTLLIDAGAVWQGGSPELTSVKLRGENPQEKLLADLGRAARLVPALETCVGLQRPTACAISLDEAYAFLRESVPLLEEAGFGVIVPPWWQQPVVRFGARLRVRPKDGVGEARSALGLQALVEYDWEVSLGEEKLSPDEFEQLAALKSPLVQVRGQWTELRPLEIEAASAFFERKGSNMTLSQALRIGLSGGQSDTGVPILGMEAHGWIRDLLAEIDRGAPMRELPSPEGFSGVLRPYQVRGYSWLAFLDQFGLGACLADDMGLGKTIQVIALLLHERSLKRSHGPTLIIAPMSVVGNWQREMERFGPSLTVMVHHGTSRLSGRAFAREAQRRDVVISTYPLAYRDHAHLSVVPWERLVLDEAQNIKNPTTRQTQALRSLKVSRRLALTGTPVENRLSDLWSIMEFLNPGYLGSAKRFREVFSTPIEKYHDARSLARLHRMVQPFLLRRLKTDPSIISDLPEKQEMKVFCQLTKEQAALYQAVVSDMLEKIQSSEGIARRGMVLGAITRLKQVCNHPVHFLRDGGSLAGRSGKLLRLVEMLDEAMSEGDRALVFTQFAEMGHILQSQLQEELGCEVLFLHGGTPRKKRDQIVRRFQDEADGAPVLVLSLKAGGTGLNLTAASHVFHFDRWWNPAVEAQATDRAFRIGQKKNVQVHKYVCVGTLEERIDRLIEEKKELAEIVVGAGEGWLTEMSNAQLRELLTLSGEVIMEG
ncbi:MAG: DEAD/DEAH box helicase [Dehalococcoidia bacterium]|nr:DEAD/DEAH box helicase [Dehalococcoidia bacterium]